MHIYYRSLQISPTVAKVSAKSPASHLTFSYWTKRACLRAIDKIEMVIQDEFTDG